VVRAQSSESRLTRNVLIIAGHPLRLPLRLLNRFRDTESAIEIV
jgi:hypothetical protein